LVHVLQQIVTRQEIVNSDYLFMKKISFLSTFILICFSQSPAMAALDRLSDFALLDSSGKFHQLSRYQHRKALVLMAYSADCPVMEEQLELYQQVQAKYVGQGVEFLLIDSADLGRPTLAAYDLALPVLEDDGQLVSESFGISKTGEVLVLNPVRSTLYYKGAPNEALDSALARVLAGSVNDTVNTASAGCQVSYAAAEKHAISPPDYATEVAPIIQKKCVGCHRQGGVGPFAMDSHIMMMGWSPMVREVLLNKRMPPTQVDPYVGHSEDARYLSKRELQTLIHWIDAGAPRGEFVDDPLEIVAEQDSGWALGEPDFIATAPEQEVPATGILDYRYAFIDLSFTEDKWITAVQYRAGDASVLHHLMTFVTAPDEDFWGDERDELIATRRFVEGYSPGTDNVSVFTKGTGVLIPKGHRLAMQLHYVTNGQATIDATQLGLYFSDEAGLQEKLVQAVATRFELPANTPNFPQQASYVFNQPVMITGVRARMNYRGKKMKFIVETAAGERAEIFSVPAYNYGWQPHYILDEPVKITQGSRVIVQGALDNSVSNPTNPDPDRAISFGLESWQEMFAGYFSFHAISQ
jgi:peroxiredoxin